MPTDDYILRSDALKAIEYKNWREENRTPTIEELHLTEYQLLAEAINKIPAADVEPVRHGRWIQSTEECEWNELECAECSECGEDYVLGEWGYEDFLKIMNYCPNCGAKMDAEPLKEEDNDNKNL